MYELQSKQQSWRLGVVSFLNARPLIAGLEADPRIELLLDVPARLPGLLECGTVDAALVPVIDLAAPHRQWRILSDACIGCDGETLTVRVFSRLPPERVSRLHTDGDSHTSVVLAEIIWREMYGRALETVPFQAGDDFEEAEAVLLIGDKVVKNTLIDHDIQTDLGQAWKSLTSLPFVFAVWAAPDGLVGASELATLLSAARDQGVRTAEFIAADLGPGMGWPIVLAKRYLTSRLKFTLGPRQRNGITKFFELARKHGIVPEGKGLVFV